MDIQEDTQFAENRIVTYLCDSTDNDSVTKVMQPLNITFDIIIDDGHHWDESQKKTFRNYFPYLNEGGLYIIEDIYPGSNLNKSPDEIKSIVKFKKTIIKVFLANKIKDKYLIDDIDINSYLIEKP
jgi:hypothetical protein